MYMISIMFFFFAVYNEQQEADSLNEPASLPEPVSSPEPSGPGARGKSSRPHRFRHNKGFFGQLLTSRGPTPTEMLDYKEPL